MPDHMLVRVAAVLAISMFPSMTSAAGMVRVEIDSIGGISLLSQEHFLERGSFVTEGAPVSLSTASCGEAPEVHIDDLEKGIALGAQFLVNSQTPEGNFRYEYDWKAQKDSASDSVVRQAGTLWGLVLAHADAADELLLPAIRKTLQFFRSHTEVLSDGQRLLHYPGQENDLGAVALITLAHIDLLRQPQRLGSGEKALLESDFNGYLKTILNGEKLHGKHAHVFYKSYREDGTPHGKNSPYYDGESLLALVKAAKFLGRSDLWDRIEGMAEAGWKMNAEPGLEAVKISRKRVTKEMKGYYQWSSMAYYELLGHDRQRFGKYAPRLLQYSDWMVAKQERAEAKGNAGYAFEGLIPAYLVSLQDQHDTERSNRLACVLRTGMHKLTGMQVGHPKALGLASEAPGSDARAQGGAQNALGSSALRIDTTQHQVHAILMMKLLMQKKELL